MSSRPPEVNLRYRPAEPATSLFDELGFLSERVAQAVARMGDGAPAADAVAWSELLRPRSALARTLEPFGLDEVELALLVLTVAPSLSHRIAQGYAVLRHDPDAPLLSAGVAMDLLGIDGARGTEALFARLKPGTLLVDLELVQVPPGGLCTMRDSIVPSSRLLAFLLGDTALPADVALAGRLEPTGRLPELVLEPEAAESIGHALAMLRTAREVDDPSAVPVALLTGPDGSGRGLCAMHLAQALGAPALRVDVRRVVVTGTPRAEALSLMRRIVREARFQGAFLYLEGLDAWDRAGDPDLLHLLEAYAPAFALGASEPFAGRALVPECRPSVHVHLGLPEPASRLILWERHAPRHPPIERGVLEMAAHKYRLTGGQIARVAGLAAHSAGVRGEPTVTPEAIDNALRASVASALTEVAREVRPTESWDDLIVSDETRLLLRVMMANYRHRRQVYDQWGFGRRFGRGLGLSALFSDPPGTGKTMAAGILARQLGLPLYQVELSRVVSKWVGETEKNLDRVFAEAEAVSAVVLFDEADSLFARRTEVSSANDRYANLEVNHLLQRIEAFEGIILLTSNNAAAIDRAFLRRFAYQLQFPLPDAAQRAQLWERLLPKEAEVAGPIRFDALAREFEFSGGHVKNAVLRAAFFAAELGRTIDERILWLTGALEQKQLGVAVRNVDVSALWRALEEPG